MILGVSFDSEEENRAFAEKFSFPFLLLCDTERAIGMAYLACDDPKASHARRISYLIGADGRIARVWDGVKAAEHPEQVLAELGASGRP